MTDLQDAAFPCDESIMYDCRGLTKLEWATVQVGAAMVASGNFGGLSDDELARVAANRARALLEAAKEKCHD